MRVLGVDPGTIRMGYGVVEDSGEKPAALDYGARAFIELLREVDRFDLARLGKGPLG